MCGLAELHTCVRNSQGTHTGNSYNTAIVCYHTLHCVLVWVHNINIICVCMQRILKIHKWNNKKLHSNMHLNSSYMPLLGGCYDLLCILNRLKYSLGSTVHITDTCTDHSAYMCISDISTDHCNTYLRNGSRDWITQP